MNGSKVITEIIKYLEVLSFESDCTHFPLRENKIIAGAYFSEYFSINTQIGSALMSGCMLNIYGHECSGVVEEIGNNVSNVQVGDRVAVCPQLKCGECEACKSGYFAACPRLLVIGAKVPGGFASYTKIPAENLLILPENVTLEEAALIEPSSVVLHGLFQTKLQPGKTVAIYGCGTIGLLTCQWAKLFGAEKVVAIDLDLAKLELAKELGADEVITPEEGTSTYSKLMELTKDEGVDLAIEAAGSAQTSEEVLAAPKKGGEVLFLGIPYSD